MRNKFNFPREKWLIVVCLSLVFVGLAYYFGQRNPYTKRAIAAEMISYAVQDQLPFPSGDVAIQAIGAVPNRFIDHGFLLSNHVAILRNDLFDVTVVVHTQKNPKGMQCFGFPQNEMPAACSTR